MTVHGGEPDPDGGYLTRGRALALEHRITELEARWEERLVLLQADVAALRTANVDQLRAQIEALLRVLRDDLGGATPIRKAGGS